jgi:hypothetical protein
MVLFVTCIRPGQQQHQPHCHQHRRPRRLRRQQQQHQQSGQRVTGTPASASEVHRRLLGREVVSASVRPRGLFP